MLMKEHVSINEVRRRTSKDIYNLFLFCVIYAFHLLIGDIKKTMMNKQVVLSNTDQEKMLGMKKTPLNIPECLTLSHIGTQQINISRHFLPTRSQVESAIIDKNFQVLFLFPIFIRGRLADYKYRLVYIQY
jgi:hypothetical protein